MIITTVLLLQIGLRVLVVIGNDSVNAGAFFWL